MTVDRLSGLDESFLRLETDAAHMHLGWIVLADGEPPGLGEVKAHVARRLDLLPRFRRRVLTSALHDATWVDDPTFDLDHHIRTAHVPAPGGSRALRDLAGQLLSARLDRSRPLWRLHVIDGLGPGRFAVVAQAHHALVDGVAAAEIAQLLVDGQPDAVAQPTAAAPGPARPGLGALAAAAVAERVRLAGSLGVRSLRAMANPAIVPETVGELRRVASALELAARAAPRTAINGSIGPTRALAFAELPLHVARELARRRRVTIDDVVLTTASLALGRYLRRRGESHPWLRVLVPVSTRTESARTLGNELSAMLVELPVGERDARAALAEVSRQTREHTGSGHPDALDALLRASRLAPMPVRDAVAWAMTRPQTFNLVLSTMPGPAEPVYLLGRRVRAAYPTVPLARAHGVSVGVLSYCGSLHVGLYAEPALVPDVTRLARGFTAAFEDLRLAVEPRTPSPGRSRRRQRVLSPV